MRYIYLALFITTFIACNKEPGGSTQSGTCTMTCSTTGLTTIFTGYEASDLDTVYVTSYSLHGSFSDTIGTLLYSTLHPDSIMVAVNGFGSIYLDPNEDYEINIPATRQTFRVAMNGTTVVDTFMCNDMPKGGCHKEFQGATITGGDYGIYETGPSPVYLMLKR
jgi:hypothetical protein